MKIFMLIVGILFCFAGVGWILGLCGEVISTKGAFSLLGVKAIGYYVFHTVCMYIGLMFILRAKKAKAE